MTTNEVNILVKDINQLSKDYLKFFDIDDKKLSLDVTNYVCDMLKNIYDKKLIKKYMYFEIIEQFVCQQIPYINNTYHFKLSDNSINKEIFR